MRKITIALISLLALALISPVLADEGQDDGMLARGYYLKAKSGHEKEFEDGLKKQIAWYRENNETWRWHTWQWETGEDFGQYIFRSPGHSWQDMDDRAERSKLARAHFMEVVSPHLESMGAGIGMILPHVSHWPEDLGMAPMVTVYEFNLNYGMSEEFMHTITKIHKAIVDSQWPVHYGWSVTISGGEMPTFWLVMPHASWADMKEPEKPFMAMLEETIGRPEAQSVMASLRECVRVQRSALARFRPELSYTPNN
jgi:hypothetical protein